MDPKHQIVETAGATSTTLSPSTRIINIGLTSAVCSRSFDDLSPRLIAARSTGIRLRTV
jgi:hypothetical protein